MMRADDRAPRTKPISRAEAAVRAKLAVLTYESRLTAADVKVGEAEVALRAARDAIGRAMSEDAIHEAHSAWVSVDKTYWDSSVYDSRLLRLMLRDPTTWPDMSQLKSAVARCLEHNLSESLNVLLAFCARRRVLLEICPRWLRGSELYVRAHECGHADIELEKRVILIQQLWRYQRAPEAHAPPRALPAYAGPVLSPREYFGFRHAAYYARWNRRARHKLLRVLQTAGRSGDCAVEGYVAAVGERPSALEGAKLWPRGMATR